MKGRRLSINNNWSFDPYSFIYLEMFEKCNNIYSDVLLRDLIHIESKNGMMQRTLMITEYLLKGSFYEKQLSIL